MAPDSNSVNINKSLKDYLKRNENGSSEEKSNLLRSWSLDSWFNKSTTSLNSEDDNSWFSHAEKDSYCGSLSKKQRIVGFMGCILMGFFCFCSGRAICTSFITESQEILPSLFNGKSVYHWELFITLGSM
ncbi:vesicle transport protein [Caerostris extrusa]|uniref:Vesicle transport protein n=1 Tax=Caerostris extrusa TaxID=172846 RepID=A0AAV4NDM7_CAEEX|nr:vesicle transport protein [Caerostris extrusa]